MLITTTVYNFHPYIFEVKRFITPANLLVQCHLYYLFLRERCLVFTSPIIVPALVAEAFKATAETQLILDVDGPIKQKCEITDQFDIMFFMPKWVKIGTFLFFLC